MNQVVGAGVGVERDVFMRTLLRELATSLESVVGLQEASGYISLVGQSVGLQLNDTYTRALSLDKLSREQVAEVMVDFKQRIGGDFHLIEQDEEKIVLGSRSCPFGEQVKGRESMCMLTSNMFGTVAARNLGYARVDLEETIARGATGCRVVVHLVPQPEDSGENSSLGREYFDDSGLVGRVPSPGPVTG
ncbi:methanogen output domain 1-containing protein [Streptomyces xinghaiensis]|uniref:methanogen output domain 1-containing protein n=1 Tax=Streptomyces xinghaiensis TaxID=1038928 RepID=UPI0002DFCCB4|nr:methanogen output domain 1-containing protein [Streptomyces xinghaiensis]MZE80197.1 transcriptional regulator [Streptomyces sp. SID5475]